MKQEREEAKARFEATVKHHEAAMAQFAIAPTDREAKHCETIAELHLTQVKICILLLFLYPPRPKKVVKLTIV